MIAYVYTPIAVKLLLPWESAQLNGVHLCASQASHMFMEESSSIIKTSPGQSSRNVSIAVWFSRNISNFAYPSEWRWIEYGTTGTLIKVERWFYYVLTKRCEYLRNQQMSINPNSIQGGEYLQVQGTVLRRLLINSSCVYHKHTPYMSLYRYINREINI